MATNEEGLVKKTKRRINELLHGDKTYLPGGKKSVGQVKQPASMPKTNRTKQVESGLKQAGLTEDEMARFMPKKGKK